MQLKWVQDRKGKQLKTDQRSNNAVLENELLDEAQERWRTAYEEKTSYTGEHLHQMWRRFDRMYRGDQWQEAVPDNKSTPVINVLMAMIQSVLPRITDTYPEFLIMPRKTSQEGAVALAKQLQSIMSYLWYQNKMQEDKIAEVTLHMLKYGTGILKTIWDPDKNDGLGEVHYSVVHPMNFFPDPRAYRIQDMEYCFTAMPCSLEYLIRRWPEKGPLVVEEREQSETEAIDAVRNPSKEHSATLKEYWYRNEEGNLCVMYYCGDVVLGVIGGELDDTTADDSPVYEHNQFPFAKLVDYTGDKEFWGFGEIELSELIQRLINNFEAQIIDNTRLLGNAQWVVNKNDSGLKEDDAWIFDNTPGKVIFTNRDGVRKEPGVPIPHHIPKHLDELIVMLEQVLGIHDVVQGKRPVGVRAASAIIALQEAANIRVRQKSKHMASALRDLVEQSIRLVMEYYDEPRHIRLAGEQIPVATNVREALRQDATQRALEAGEIQFDEDLGIPPEEMDRAMEVMAFPQFDVEVKVGPSLPYSQALLYEQSKEFYQLGIIDREAVLEASNFPNKDEILRRMEEKEAQAREMEGLGSERVGERTI